MRGRVDRLARMALLTAGLAGVALLTAAAASAGTLGFRDILPVGQGQNVSSAGLANYESTGKPPASFTNQEAMFERLLYDGPSLTASKLRRDFKPAPNGLVPGTALSTQTPRPGVRITLDTFEVPHVDGATRADAMFGAGYAQASERLFEMDLLRHLGKADLAEFLGPSYLPMDRAVWMQSDYTDSELQAQLNALPREYGPAGTRALDDERAYVAGINAYIRKVRSDPLLLPGEYAALHTVPSYWTAGDSVAIAAEINEGFDLGGGGQVADAQLLGDLRTRLGRRDGAAAYQDLRAFDDPAAPTTTNRPFAFESAGRTNPASVAMPDPGSVRPVNPVLGAGHAAHTGMAPAGALSGLLASRLAHEGGESFAYLVGAKGSRSGHPLADMGPQLDFYSPEVVLEEDLHGPGIDVRGAALPGALPVPIVGHTPRFAWSVTIGVGDHIDIFAERLCNPNGAPATRASTHYVYHGHCVPLAIRDRSEHTTPNALDESPPESFTLRTIRSIHGPVQSIATVRGHPVAYARDDAIYFHLADVGVFYDNLLSGGVRGPASFVRTVAETPFSLNWFYIDSRNIAWTLSGRYPLRARGTNPDLPAWGSGRWNWRGFDPSTHSERFMAQPTLPHTINPPQGFIANWNNKPAPRWRAASDDFYYSSAQRVQMVRRRIASALHDHHRIGIVRLASLVEDVATADMRGEIVLPWALRVIGKISGPRSRLVSILRHWVRTGAHRRDLRRRGYYDDSPPVALMNAWWPMLVRGIFEPVVGRAAYRQATHIDSIDDLPDVDAEAWYSGWYGQVVQDLHDVLARRRGTVVGHFSRVYCGGTPSRNGSLGSCRSLLLSTLAGAARTVAAAQHTAKESAWRVPTTCPVPSSGFAPCDEIVFSPLGAVGTAPIPWQNRPTFQQLVELGR